MGLPVVRVATGMGGGSDELNSLPPLGSSRRIAHSESPIAKQAAGGLVRMLNEFDRSPFLRRYRRGRQPSSFLHRRSLMPVNSETRIASAHQHAGGPRRLSTGDRSFAAAQFI